MTTSEIRKRGRPQKLDRKHLLDAAMPVYWREGPAAVSVNAICQRTGVSKPSLYREFGSEDGFTKAVLEAYAAVLNPVIAAILSGDGSFREKLDALIDYASDSTLSDHGCLFFKLRGMRTSLGEKTRSEVDALEAGMIEAYAAFLRSSRDDGTWPGSIPVELGARYLFAQIGLALERRAAGDDPVSIRDVLTLALSPLDGSGRRT